MPDRKLFALFVMLAMVSATLIVPGSASATLDPDIPADFRVGAAVVDISPSKLVNLATQRVCLGGFGIGCSRPATGERETLYARALVIESGGKKIAIATATNIGLFAAYQTGFDAVGAYDARQAAAAQSGIPAEAITVTSDHSHSGPDVNGIWGGSDAAYLRAHADRITQAIVDANAALEPAQILVGSTTLAKPATNDPLKNHWENSGGVLDQIDRELRVLQARSLEDDSVIATMVNFAPHASILDGDDGKASGDWTGELGNRLATRLGGVGMGMVGALGGIGARANDAQFGDFVTIVEGLTDQALATATPIDVGGVEVSRTFIREAITSPLLYAAYVPVPATHPANPIDASIDRSVTPPWTTGAVMGTYVSTYRIGDVLLGMTPGEAYPQISFDFSNNSTAREHFVFGLADDQVGYLISPLEGVETAARNGALYPATGNDNYALSVSTTIGEHVACALLDGARELGFPGSDESEFCMALTVADGIAGPNEHPGSGS